MLLKCSRSITAAMYIVLHWSLKVCSYVINFSMHIWPFNFVTCRPLSVLSDLNFQIDFSVLYSCVGRYTLLGTDTQKHTCYVASVQNMGKFLSPWKTSRPQKSVIICWQTSLMGTSVRSPLLGLQHTHTESTQVEKFFFLLRKKVLSCQQQISYYTLKLIITKTKGWKHLSQITFYTLQE